MLEKTMKELGLEFCGRWEDMGSYLFKINNPKMVSNGTTFTVFNADKLSLINAMNETEEKWINFRINNKYEEEEETEAMCKNTKCLFALVAHGQVMYCSFYEKGKNNMPEQCQIPYLRGDMKEPVRPVKKEVVIDLVDEVV